MKRLTITILILSIAAAGLAASEAVPDKGRDKAAQSAQPIAIRCGKLLTMNADKTVINGGIILIRDGKIEAVGHEKDVAIPDGYRVIDGSRRWVMPGLVDFHSHVGGSMGDLNDPVYLTNPDLRNFDTVTPESEYARDARASGVTTMLLIPGSSNNMSGFGSIIKSAGRTPEDVALKIPGVIKLSQAGNPERYWYRVGRFMMYWNLRTTLEEMKAYHDEWCAYENGEGGEKPEFDPFKEDFRDVFRRETSALIHSQSYQLMVNSMNQIWDDLGIHVVMGHCTFDGYKTAPDMAERDVPIMAGPRNIWLDRHDRRVFGIPAKYAEGGVKILGTNTDAPVLPIEEHFYQTTIAVRMGWDDCYDALEGLTIEAARAGITSDRVGSIEPGKDADIAFYNGDPIDPRSACTMTIVNGDVVYDSARDGQRY